MSDTQNKKMATRIVIVPLVMLSLAFASVPLYDVFCAITGFGGTTSTNVKTVEATNIPIIIRFDASVGSNVPVDFKPVQREMEMKMGEDALAFYTVTNLTNEEITTTSTYNVVPYSTGEYFVKINCFCFEEQKLKPGETVEMPLTFYIDPAMSTDKKQNL